MVYDSESINKVEIYFLNVSYKHDVKRAKKSMT